MTRRMMSLMWFEGVGHDIRDSIRAMRKRKGFTALAVATLALGIGVNVTSMAVAYGILVRPLPYAEPSRVVLINLRFADGGDMGFGPEVIQTWLPRLHTVDRVAGYYRREVTVQLAGRSTVVPAAFVTDQFFDVLRASIERGRVSSDARAATAVVGRRWLNQFMPGDSVSVGAPLSVSGELRTIGALM